MHSRTFDIILTGVSTSVGQHALEYFLDHVKQDQILWGVADNSDAQFPLSNQFRQYEIQNFPIDVTNYEELHYLFADTKVVINCFPPEISEVIIHGWF